MPVKVDMKPLRAIRASVEAALSGTPGGPVHRAVKVWGYIGRSYLQERFDRHAAGGGNWPRLKKATIRRKRRLGIQPFILVETRTLRSALDPTLNTRCGGYEEWVKGAGLVIGYGGNALHPGHLTGPTALEPRRPVRRIKRRREAWVGLFKSPPMRRRRTRRRLPSRRRRGGSEQTITVARLAEIHQEGEGNVPQRRIIVAIPGYVQAKLAGVMKDALKAQIKMDTGR